MRKTPAWLMASASLVAALLLLPVLSLIYDSFSHSGSALEIIFQKRNFKVLSTSLLLAFSCAITSTIVALPIAWLCTRCQIYGQKLWTLLTILPLVFPSFLCAYGYIAVFSSRGMLYKLTGTTIPWDIQSFFGAWLTTSFVNYPFVLMTCRAALLKQDPALEEASRNLGLSRTQSFFRVTLPLLKPAIFSGALMVALYSLSDLGTPTLMGVRTFTYEIYNAIPFGKGESAILALMLIITAIIILYAGKIFQHKGQLYSLSSGTKKPLKKIQLSPIQQVSAQVYLFMIFFISVILPVGAIAYWYFTGTGAEDNKRAWIALWHSSYTAILAAICTTIIAIPIAYFCARHKGKVSSLMDKFSFLGNATPGIVIALALVVVFVKSPLYQTIFVMILGYSIRFTPQAYAALKNTFLQISPKLEEASRNLGHSSFKTLCKITLPLAIPGIISSLALVFITTIKELPITLLLSARGKNYLPAVLWRQIDEGEYSEVNGPALMLLGISTISLIFILQQEKRNNNV